MHNDTTVYRRLGKVMNASLVASARIPEKYLFHVNTYNGAVGCRDRVMISLFVFTLFKLARMKRETRTEQNS